MPIQSKNGDPRVRLGASAIFLALGACAGDDAGDTSQASATSAATSSTGTAAEDTGCPLGSEGCPCMDGDSQCAGELVCLSETCVRLPEGPGTGDGPAVPPTTGAYMTGDTGGNPPECNDVFACEDDYVCVVGECVHAWDLTWEMRVLSFMPPSCNEGIAGDLDPDYLVWRDGELLTDAPEEACPSTWPNTVTTIEPFSPTNDPFQVDFWDNDPLGAQDLCTWRWDSLGNGEVGPIPAAWLVSGGWSGSFDGGCSAEFEFALAE